MLIGVAGLSGSGKNYCTNILHEILAEQQLSTKEYAFGDKLKQVCASATNTRLYLWYMEELKDVPNAILAPAYSNDAEFCHYVEEHCKQSIYSPVSMRWWMQNYSDFLKRSLNHPDVFVDYVITELSCDKRTMLELDVQIVTDVRHVPEVEAIKKRKGHVAYIFNPNLKIEEKHSHNSEQLDKGLCDFVLYNDKAVTSDSAIRQQWLEFLQFYL